MSVLPPGFVDLVAKQTDIRVHAYNPRVPMINNREFWDLTVIFLPS